MNLMVVGQLYYHVPWLARIQRMILSGAREVDALIVTGNLCSMVMPRDDRSRQCQTIRAFLERVAPVCPIFYADGAYDPANLTRWGIDRVHTAGTHIHDGWLIHVLSSRHPGDEIYPTSAQSIIVSDMPPALSRTGVGPNGDHVGTARVREAIVNAGDCRLVLHGGCIDPLSHADWAEGSMCVNVGLPIREHGNDNEPAFAMIDCERRMVDLFDGQRVVTHSFAREL